MNRFRHEYKYIIDAYIESILMIRAKSFLTLDSYAGIDGMYTVRSLYFDDINNLCYYDNDAGTDPRSKFRIRYYNDDSLTLSLEKKSKVRGMTYKESCPLSKEEYDLIIQGQYSELLTNDEKKKSLFLEMKYRELLPKVIVTYDRMPFIYPVGNVRITFDKALSSSSDINGFIDGSYRRRPILKNGSTILEIKWDELLPVHIKEAIGDNSLQWSSFSKYYMCRCYCI